MSNSKSQTTFTLISGIMGGLILTLFTQPLISAQSDNVVTETSTVSINLFQAFILGLIQGLTEFLPISSTAHLKVIPVALGWGDPGVAFTSIIKICNIISVLLFFSENLIDISQGIFK
jgi:undecaprenyl-diphosphatase